MVKKKWTEEVLSRLCSQKHVIVDCTGLSASVRGVITIWLHFYFQKTKVTADTQGLVLASILFIFFLSFAFFYSPLPPSPPFFSVKKLVIQVKNLL